jgi:hypothetical protein
VNSWVDVEGCFVVEVALRVVIVVKSLWGCGELDGELYLNGHGCVEGPVVEGVGEVAGLRIKEDGVDDVAVLCVVVVVDVELQITKLSIDDVLGNVVNVETVGDE